DLHHVLGRDERLLDLLLLRRLPLLLRDPDVDQLLDLVLMPRVRLDRVPPCVGHGRHHAKMFMMRSTTPFIARSMTQMIADTISTNAMMTPVAFLSWSRSGHVTFFSSSVTSPMKSRVRVMIAAIYLVSLCCVWRLHRRQG